MSLRTWRLDTPGQTLALVSEGGALPEVIHWGAALPEGTDLAALRAATRIDLTGGQLDATPPLSLCPEASRSFPGQPGLILRAPDAAPVLPRFRYGTEEKVRDGIVLSFDDDLHGLTLNLGLRADPETGILTLQTALNSAERVWLHRLCAPVLPAPPHATEMLDFAGRWTGEFQPVRTPWQPGIRLRENRTGRTGHEHFSGLVIPGPAATNTSGEAWAFHYAWSGGHRMAAEELPDGRRQVQWSNADGSELQSGLGWHSAPLLVAYSAQGLNGTATAFQRHLRDRIVPWPDRDRPRPVHYNCWEAVYFDHDPATLKDIATRAAKLGAERFVLDDGWFGRRDDATTSLGDWQVDPRKWPDGLTPMIDHVHAEGMTFGLWVEPEMVSPDSDLARAHPDWILRPDGPLGRDQHCLDMSLGAVQNHLHAALSRLLTDHPIDYLKWDHNRVLPGPDAAQARGTYALLDRLRADHPGVEIESCASGGGRIDPGILSRTHRVWLSDSNDALERQRIQHEAALFLPAAVTGSHVGPRRCHTSGRVLPMSLRAWTAAQRHMGFEMDPRELTEDEAATLREVTAWWKANRDWMMRADIHRLDHPDPAILAEQQQARNGTRFVAFAARLAASAQTAPRPLRLTALDPAATYRLKLLNRAEAPGLSRAAMPIKDGPLELPGVALMATGLALPWSEPASIWVVEGIRL
jgi:alpha-galactosidase